MTYAIECQEITYTWPQSEHCAINIDSFTVEQGERLFIHGASGSGKSTLLSVIAGLLTVKNGELKVLGHSFSQMSDRQKDRFRAKHIGFVFQQFNLIPYLSAQDNISLPAKISGLQKRLYSTRIRSLMDSLLLEEGLLNQRADQLSIGQQQRVAVARALINEPEILIADEPTSALDEEAKDEFMDLLLKTQQRTGSTVIFVSHDRALMKHFNKHQSMTELNTALPKRGSHVL